jgi:hypothetical protein
VEKLKEVFYMKKLQIVLEVEINENAINEIETTDGEHFTKNEYIN